MAPQNRNTQIGKAKEGEEEGQERERGKSLAYYIILRSLNIISKSKLNRQTQKEKQRKGERKDLSLCLFVCPVPVAVELGEITRFIMIQSDCSLCSAPPHRIAPPCAAHNLYGLQANWHYVALEKTKPRQSDTETETGLVANRSCGKKFKLKPRANRPSACKVNLKRLRRCGDTPHKKLVNDTNVPHEAVDICMYDPE